MLSVHVLRDLRRARPLPLLGPPLVAMAATIVVLGALALGVGSAGSTLNRDAAVRRAGDNVRPSGLDQSVSSAHFVIHYTTSGANAATADDAAFLSAAAERAYALEVGQWGWEAPLDDGDGKTDVYIEGTAGAEAGSAVPDTGGTAPTTAFIVYGSSSAPNRNDILIMHEFLHVLQFSRSRIPMDNQFLREALAIWSSSQSQGGTAFTFVPWGLPAGFSLDCADATACNQGGGGDGQAFKWVFFEYLAERFGPSVMHEIWDDASALGPGFDPLQAIQNTLARHGSNLATVWNDYATATVWNDFTIASLKDHPTMPGGGQDLSTNGQPVTVTVDHLDIAYLTVLTTSAPDCIKGTLRLTVTFPAGIGAQPAFAKVIGGTAGGHQVDERPTPLTAGTGGAAAVVPWWQCNDLGTLVLPNPSRQDGVAFTVAATFIPPSTCVVPSLTGLTDQNAYTALAKAGCVLGSVVRVASPPSLKLRVVIQKPLAGAKVKGGTRVTIYLGNGKKSKH